MSEVTYCFITSKSRYYWQTVDLRYRVLYEPSGATIYSALDEKEDKSIHLVAIYQGNAIGYIRLTINEQVAQITQFVVAESMRGKQNIAKTLYSMIAHGAKELGAKKLYGEIRLPVVKAAKRAGFRVSDDIFPSGKTGILHRAIEKSI